MSPPRDPSGILQPVAGTESRLLATTVPVPDGWMILVRDISDLSPAFPFDYHRLDSDRSALLSVMDQVLPADEGVDTPEEKAHDALVTAGRQAP